MMEIAAHFLKRGGEGRTSVYSKKESIQDVNRRFAIILLFFCVSYHRLLSIWLARPGWLQSFSHSSTPLVPQRVHKTPARFSIELLCEVFLLPKVQLYLLPRRGIGIELSRGLATTIAHDAPATGVKCQGRFHRR